MGLLDLFVEKVVDNDTCVNDYEAMVDAEPDVALAEIDMDGVNVDTLVRDIYERNGMQDVSKSIFKVEEACASLPDTMAESTKKQSVSSILGIFGLTVDEVVEDGKQRLSLIGRALDDITNTAATDVAMMESQVEEHKREIERLEGDISAVKANEKSSREQIREEAERIAKLMKFIGGDDDVVG